jgi:excisionase family DNA binding protein
MKNSKQISSQKMSRSIHKRPIFPERRPVFPSIVEPALYPIYFLSLRETAAILGVCVRTVQNYISEGRLKCVVIGRRTKRIRNIDLDEFGQGLQPDLPPLAPETGPQLNLGIQV